MEQQNRSLQISDSSLQPYIHFIWLKNGFIPTGGGVEETERWQQLPAAWYLLCHYGSLHDHEQHPAHNPGERGQPCLAASLETGAPCVFTSEDICTSLAQVSICPWVLFLCGQNQVPG